MQRTATHDHDGGSVASMFARISYAQAGLIGLMVLAATAMARGYGYFR